MVSGLSGFYGCFSVFKETLSDCTVPIRTQFPLSVLMRPNQVETAVHRGDPVFFLGGGAPLRNGATGTAEYQLY